MQVISVIPVQKGIPLDVLTYFSHDPIPEGFLVKVPLQSREILGLTIETQSLTEAKLNIKSSAFALKKIKQIIGPSSIDATFLQACRISARKSFIPLGAFLGDILSVGALEQRQYLTKEQPPIPAQKKTHFIQGKTEERADEYKVLIRNAFALGTSALLVAPTVATALRLKEILGKGIERRIFLLHGDLTKTEKKRTFHELFESYKGVLLIATPHFATLPWFSAGLIILDEISHIGYQSRSRYKIDYGDFFMTLSAIRHSALCLGDRLIPFRYLWEEEKTPRLLFPRKYVPEKLHIIDAARRPFQLAPDELVTLLQHAAATHKNVFIYAYRKGIAPYSVCRSCKTVVQCKQCKTALYLRHNYNSDGIRERLFLCPECGHNEPATYTCVHCGSWDIDPKEVGIDALKSAVLDLHLELPLIIIESDGGSDAFIQEQLKTITPDSGCIIIGTERAFSFLPDSQIEINFSVIPHIDRLLGRTTLDAGEKTLRLLYTLDDLSSEAVVLVTKNPSQSFMTALEKKEVARYVETEKSTAQMLGYPPFGAIIKISIRVPEDKKDEAVLAVVAACKPLEAFHVSSKRSRPGAAFLTLSFVVKAGTSFFEGHLGHYDRFLEAIYELPYRPIFENDPTSLW